MGFGGKEPTTLVNPRGRLSGHRGGATERGHSCGTSRSLARGAGARSVVPWPGCGACIAAWFTNPSGPLLLLEVRSSGSLEGCGGGSARAVLEPIVPPGPPVPHDQPPPRAETSNSALQSAQSERNVIALPRGSGTRMLFRKGAAYWSPGATRLEERRSLGKTWPCPPPLSGILVLHPRSCPASRTRCVSGPTTQTALTIWKAGPATRIVLTLPIPATVWPRARKPGSRQLRNMPTATAGASVRVGPVLRSASGARFRFCGPRHARVPEPAQFWFTCGFGCLGSTTRPHPPKPFPSFGLWVVQTQEKGKQNYLRILKTLLFRKRLNEVGAAKQEVHTWASPFTPPEALTAGINWSSRLAEILGGKAEARPRPGSWNLFPLGPSNRKIGPD